MEDVQFDGQCGDDRADGLYDVIVRGHHVKRRCCVVNRPLDVVNHRLVVNRYRERRGFTGAIGCIWVLF